MIAIGREFQNGVPFGPTFLSYPLTEIDADYTIGTHNHRAYMADSSILKLFLRLDLLKLNLGRGRKFMSIFGTFWGAVPHIGVASPKLVCVIKPTPSPNIVQNITPIA